MPFDHVTCAPERTNGQPCIRNLRLTVRRVLEAMAMYPDRQELRREYPELEDEDLCQALEYAAACLDDRTPYGPRRHESTSPPGLSCSESVVCHCPRKGEIRRWQDG